MDQVYTHTFDAPRRAADAKIDAYFSAQIADAKNQNGNKTAMESKKPKKYKLHRG